MTDYPVVPGHEIVGRVTEVGAEVKKFAPGDLAAVRMHGGLLSHLSRLQRRPGAVLPGRVDADLQQPREADRPDDLRRLFRQNRRGPGLRSAGPGPAGSGRRGPAALRRHHDVLPASALGGWPRQPGRHRRARRPGPYGRQAGARARRGGDPVHHLAGQDRDAKRLGADQVVISRDADQMAKQQPVGSHRRHRGRVARPRART